jgi:hypothetical protein
MLTFEFPDETRARAFAVALDAQRWTAGARDVKHSHRVVDVPDPTDDDPTVARAARDYLIVLAVKHGAEAVPMKGPVTLTLDGAEVHLLREALDSHKYWQLSDESDRHDGSADRPDDDERGAEWDACEALEARLGGAT